jgi:hypothetical protein
MIGSLARERLARPAAKTVNSGFAVRERANGMLFIRDHTFAGGG